MRLGYELSTVPLCTQAATLCTSTQCWYAQLALPWSSLYIVQDSLLLNDLLVITEWMSNTLPLHLKTFKRYTRLLPTTRLEALLSNLTSKQQRYCNTFKTTPWSLTVGRLALQGYFANRLRLWGWKQALVSIVSDDVDSEEDIRRDWGRDGRLDRSSLNLEHWTPRGQKTTSSCFNTRKLVGTIAMQSPTLQDGGKESSYYCQGKA